MDTTEKPLVLGEITGHFGIKGWVKLRSYTRPREQVFDYSTWLLGNGQHWQPIKWKTKQITAKAMMVKLAGFDSREQSQSWIGCQIAVSPTQLPALTDGEYYWSELIGLTVSNQDGERLGCITDMLETGANDVMSISPEDSKETRLIPYIDDVVVSVDLQSATMIVDWPFVDE